MKYQKGCFVKRLTDHCCIILNPPKLQNSYKYNVAVYLYYVHGAWNLSWYIFKAQEDGARKTMQKPVLTRLIQRRKASAVLCPNPILVLLKSSLQARR